MSVTSVDTKIERLMQEFPSSFSSALGIDLSSQSSKEIFKWFLASILFGARISETIVVNTYKVFEKEGILSPQRILKTGWDGLVARLDEGGYVRYDFKTADKLLEVMRSLLDQYDGNLQNVHDRAQDPRDLEKRLQDLGRGIGNVTTNIFLRELRGLWPKAEPLPSSLMILAARNLKLIAKSKPTEILQELKTIWEENKITGKDFVDFEAALLRLGKDFCRKRKCDTCALEELCEQKDSG